MRPNADQKNTSKENNNSSDNTNLPREPNGTPGDHWQNPADPTRKDGDVTPVYADERLASGEDLQEPTPSRRTLENLGADAHSQILLNSAKLNSL